MGNYYTYILQPESSGKYYVGHTHDLEQRLRQHNLHDLSGSPATKRLQGPWRLVYFEEYATRSDAIKRERAIKSWKSSKAIQRLLESR